MAKAGIFLFVGAWVGAKLLFPLILTMLSRAGLVRPNWQGDNIPVGAGILFVPLTAVFLTIAFTLELILPFHALIILFAGIAMGFLGLIDDCLGSRESRGFRGHFRKLAHGELTTGALKAIGGGITALTVVLALDITPVFPVIVATLVIALTTNTLNLFDLRPGRALKVFFLGFALLIALRGLTLEPLLLFVPSLGIAAAYLPYDLKAKAMLGDTGSNILGILLGLAAVFALSWPQQIILLVILVLFQLFAERYSLSTLIERNRFLRFLDQLGRPH